MDLIPIWLLLFSDLNKAQIYKMSYRHSPPHHEIEIPLSFDYLNVFKLNKHTEDFLIEIGDKKYGYVGEKKITFGTNDKIVKYNSEYGFNDVKFPYAYGEENIYFMLYEDKFLFKNM